MNKKIKMTITMIIAVCFCASSAVFAADGSWTATASGNWSDGGNWDGGTVAGGSGSTAYLTNAIPGTVACTIDTATTIGSINFTDGDAIPNNRDLLDGGVPLTLAGSPTISSDASVAQANIKCVLAGTEGFTLTGDGLVNLGLTSNEVSGTVNLNTTTTIKGNNKDALMNADVVIGTSSYLSRKNEFNAKSIVVNNTGILDLSQTDDASVPVKVQAESIIVNNGGTLGAGNDATAPLTGHSFDLVSPSITVNTGGRIKINAAGTKTVSGSNIVVNSGGEVGFFGNSTTYTLNNPLVLDGWGIAPSLGALTVQAVSTLTNNGHITIGGSTRIGQYGGGDASMVLNGPISGGGPCILLAQAGHHTHIRRFELYGANDYTGNSSIEGFACQNITTLHGDQRLPNTDLNLQVHNWDQDTTNVFNLNGYTQAVTKLDVNPGLGADLIKVLGNGGKIYTSGDTDINGAFCDWQADLVGVNKQFQINSGASLTIANSTIDVGDWGQLRPAWLGAAGATTTVNIDNGGKVVCYSLRVADINGTPIVNINAGGEVKCADVYVGNATALTAGKINIDGGTLSDSTVDYASTNWIHGFKGLDLTVDIKAGGATFDIDNQYKSISEVISGVGDLTKTGSKTLAFEAAPTLTGNINVNEGGLLVNCDMSSAAVINVATGATVKLIGEAVVGNITLTDGSSIAPGLSFGTNTAGAIVMKTGSSVEWEVGGGGNDLVIADSLDVSSAIVDINVTVVGDIVASDTNMLFKLNSVVTADETTIVNINGVGTDAAELVYAGNDILITGVVPEPAIFGLLAILGLAFFRRK